MSGRLPLWRYLLVLAGNVLVATGLGFGLIALAMLALGSPAAWLGESPEPVTLLHRATMADKAAVAGGVGLPDTSDRAISQGLAASPTSQPAPPEATPLATSLPPTTLPMATSTELAPAAARPDIAAVATVAHSNPLAARTPFLPITRMVIPRLGLETEVAQAILTEQAGGMTWEVPAFRAGHAEGTAGAGGLGTAVLLGHVTSRAAGSVFRDLGRAQVGDEIRVFSEEKEFGYRVVDLRTVSRTDVSALRPTRKARLSLITCAGTWVPLLHDYTERLVVHAELDHYPIAPSVSLPGPEVDVPVTASPLPAAPSTTDRRDGLTTVLEEHFAEPRQQWPNEPLAPAWFEGGSYVMSARQPGRFVAVGAPLERPLSDVVVTAMFRKVGGPPGGGYGLIVRDQGPGRRDGVDQGGRYYVLEVGDRGELGIWRREEDTWIDLLPWTPSDAVRPGTAHNELTVRAVGTRLTLVVNGADVATLDDSALPAGGVGVFVGGDLNEVRLERLTVQALP